MKTTKLVLFVSTTEKSKIAVYTPDYVIINSILWIIKYIISFMERIKGLIFFILNG